MSFIANFNRYDSPKAWRELFSRLEHDSSNLMLRKRMTTKCASQLQNTEKNRYINVLPYDQNRVQLLGANDYINASFVTVPKANREYILSQGPVEESLADFWQMIYEQNVPAIVMLNRLFEGGSPKCEKYYPCTIDSTVTFGHFVVHLEEEIQMQNFISRKFTLKNTETGKTKTVYHIQYTDWPDFGVPESTANFLEMLNYIKGLKVLAVKKGDPPVVVHCSAGIGRSGTFILVDSILRMVELKIPQNEIDPNHLLVDLRSQRMGLIQTSEQLQFAWTAIIDGYKNSEVLASGDIDQENEITTTINGNLRKRKSETREELDEKTSKRREMISNMVQKNRQCEDARNGGSIFSSSSIIFGGVAAVASIFIYYYFRR